MLVVFQLYFYFSRALFFGFSWQRIGLPFMKGTSSNPGGFVLGSCAIFYFGVVFKIKKRNWLSIITFLLILVSMVFTISRTNILALAIVLLLKYLTDVIKDIKALAKTVIIFLFVLIIFMIMAAYLKERAYIFRTFLLILENPAYIFSDTSFMVRFTEFWPRSFKLWHTSVWTILFGAGLGTFKVVDGTLPRLLGDVGVVGLILFFYIWIGFFLMTYGRNKWLRMLLLFVVINSITAETLITSYRTMQIYIPILLTFVYSIEYLERSEKINNEITKNLMSLNNP